MVTAISPAWRPGTGSKTRSYTGIAARKAASKLLRDDAAGDALAGIARGVGLHVIGLGVNDDGCAPVAEERVRIGGEIHVFVQDGGLRCSVGRDHEVRHI